MKLSIFTIRTIKHYFQSVADGNFRQTSEMYTQKSKWTDRLKQTERCQEQTDRGQNWTDRRQNWTDRRQNWTDRRQN